MLLKIDSYIDSFIFRKVYENISGNKYNVALNNEIV